MSENARLLRRILIAHHREFSLAPIRALVKLAPINGLEIIRATHELELSIKNGMVYTGDGRNFEDFFLERNA